MIFLKISLLCTFTNLIAGRVLKCGEDIVIERGDRKTLKFWSSEEHHLKVEIVSQPERQNYQSSPAVEKRPFLGDSLSVLDKSGATISSSLTNILEENSTLKYVPVTEDILEEYTTIDPIDKLILKLTTEYVDNVSDFQEDLVTGTNLMEKNRLEPLLLQFEFLNATEDSLVTTEHSLESISLTKDKTSLLNENINLTPLFIEKFPVKEDATISPTEASADELSTQAQEQFYKESDMLELYTIDALKEEFHDQNNDSKTPTEFIANDGLKEETDTPFNAKPSPEEDLTDVTLKKDTNKQGDENISQTEPSADDFAKFDSEKHDSPVDFTGIYDNDPLEGDIQEQIETEIKHTDSFDNVALIGEIPKQDNTEIVNNNMANVLQEKVHTEIQIVSTSFDNALNVIHNKDDAKKTNQPALPEKDELEKVKENGDLELSPTERSESDLLKDESKAEIAMDIKNIEAFIDDTLGVEVQKQDDVGSGQTVVPENNLLKEVEDDIDLETTPTDDSEGDVQKEVEKENDMGKNKAEVPEIEERNQLSHKQVGTQIVHTSFTNNDSIKEESQDQEDTRVSQTEISVDSTTKTTEKDDAALSDIDSVSKDDLEGETQIHIDSPTTHTYILRDDIFKETVGEQVNIEASPASEYNEKYKDDTGINYPENYNDNVLKDVQQEDNEEMHQTEDFGSNELTVEIQDHSNTTFSSAYVSDDGVLYSDANILSYQDEPSVDDSSKDSAYKQNDEVIDHTEILVDNAVTEIYIQDNLALSHTEFSVMDEDSKIDEDLMQPVHPNDNEEKASFENNNSTNNYAIEYTSIAPALYGLEEYDKLKIKDNLEFINFIVNKDELTEMNKVEGAKSNVQTHNENLSTVSDDTTYEQPLQDNVDRLENLTSHDLESNQFDVQFSVPSKEKVQIIQPAADHKNYIYFEIPSSFKNEHFSESKLEKDSVLEATPVPLVTTLNYDVDFVSALYEIYSDFFGTSNVSTDEKVTTEVYQVNLESEDIYNDKLSENTESPKEFMNDDKQLNEDKEKLINNIEDKMTFANEMSIFDKDTHDTTVSSPDLDVLEEKTAEQLQQTIEDDVGFPITENIQQIINSTDTYDDSEGLVMWQFIEEEASSNDNTNKEITKSETSESGNDIIPTTKETQNKNEIVIPINLLNLFSLNANIQDHKTQTSNFEIKDMTFNEPIIQNKNSVNDESKIIELPNENNDSGLTSGDKILVSDQSFVDSTTLHVFGSETVKVANNDKETQSTSAFISELQDYKHELDQAKTTKKAVDDILADNYATDKPLSDNESETVSPEPPNQGIKDTESTYQERIDPARKDDSGVYLDEPFFIRLPGSDTPVPVIIEYEPVKIQYVNVDEVVKTELDEVQQDTLTANKEGENITVENVKTINIPLEIEENIAVPQIEVSQERQDNVSNGDNSQLIHKLSDSNVKTKENPLLDGIYRLIDDIHQSQFLDSNEYKLFKPNKPIIKNPDPFFEMKAPNLAIHRPDNIKGKIPDVPMSGEQNSYDVLSKYSIGNTENLKYGVVEDVPLTVDHYPGYSGSYGLDISLLNNPVFSLLSKTTLPSHADIIDPPYTPFPITTNPPVTKANINHVGILSTLSVNKTSRPPGIDFFTIPSSDFRESYHPSYLPSHIKNNRKPSIETQSLSPEAYDALAAALTIDFSDYGLESERPPLPSYDDQYNSYDSLDYDTDKNNKSESQASFSSDYTAQYEPRRVYSSFYSQEDIPGQDVQALGKRKNVIQGFDFLPGWNKTIHNATDDKSLPADFKFSFIPKILELEFEKMKNEQRSKRSMEGKHIFCEWDIKTKPGQYLLMTFSNLSAPYTVDCESAYIEVERSNNGYDARWCGNRFSSRSSRPHVIFAKSELRLAVYDDGMTKKDPTGFEAEVEVIDLFDKTDYTTFMKSSAYPQIRRLLEG